MADKSNADARQHLRVDTPPQQIPRGAVAGSQFMASPSGRLFRRAGFTHSLLCFHCVSRRAGAVILLKTLDSAPMAPALISTLRFYMCSAGTWVWTLGVLTSIVKIFFTSTDLLHTFSAFFPSSFTFSLCFRDVVTYVRPVFQNLMLRLTTEGPFFYEGNPLLVVTQIYASS